MRKCEKPQVLQFKFWSLSMCVFDEEQEGL